MLKKIALASVCLTVSFTAALAQTKTNTAALQKTALEYRDVEVKNFEKALSLAKQKGWPASFKSRNNNVAFLVGVDNHGYPIYFSTESNIDAAATTGASQLWTGGSLGLNLSGSSANMKDKLAIWDGGRVLGSHVELAGRVVQRDNPSSISDHSTHVSGTMIASGVNPISKGMSYGLKEMIAYDFNLHISEMSAEAPSLLLSNHSYGAIAGWRYNTTSSRWEFWGRAGENEDYKFGYYSSETQMFDSIAYNSPYYLIVKASGNNRSETGPAVGAAYYRYDLSGNMVNSGTRPAGISNNDGYDIISTYGTAKNVLTVGAIEALPFGYTNTNNTLMSSFSSWGPTDDGRIKPDIVADGVDVVSSISVSDTANKSSYGSYSGTSMATPNTTGSLLLLQEYYSQLNGGAFMRSATLKALAIHTADDAGTAPGPDYQYGWGVLNVAKAAAIIKAKNTSGNFIQENVLNNGATYTFNVVASGRGTLTATIVWTDPKGSVDASEPLNSPAKKLVNDLDMRINKGTTVYTPWILTPSVPSAAATTGDNDRDNVEKIEIPNAIPGTTYTITINHKGTLERGLQAYSLIVTGAGGQAYCSSTPTANSGARIEEVNFGGIQKINPAGCTTFTDNTAVSGSIQPAQTLPITVKVGSCDATVTDKVVKVYIDYNNNGSFADAGEEVAVSGVINGNGTFSGSITTPLSLTPGNSTLMRVVVQETANAANIASCGTYSKGETQDYRLLIATPSNDVALVQVSDPANGSCSNTAQYPTIKVRNAGAADAANIPVRLIVADGATTVATIDNVVPLTVTAGNVAEFTLQSPFATLPGKTYTLTAITRFTSDQNKGNDTLRTTFTTSNPATPAGVGEMCGPNVSLNATNSNSSLNYFWFNSATSETAIARGSSAVTTVTAPNNTYYLRTGTRGTLGLASREAFPGGGSYLTSPGGNYINYTAATNVVLESAKMYIRYPGQIEFIVADITPLQSGGYQYLSYSSTTIDVHATSPTPVAGAAPFDAADTGAIFNLNIVLPAGSHSIIVLPKGNTNIFRNNNVTGNPYPFSIPNLIDLTGNSVTAPTNFQGYYYYLYNMRMSTFDCPGSKATVVANVVPTPVLTQQADSIVSTGTGSQQWYKDGIALTGVNGRSYRPTQSGGYSVVTTSTSGCVLVSNTINFVLTAIQNIPATEIGLATSPNPSNGTFRVQFKVLQKDDLSVQVINAQGQAVYSKQQPKFVGTYTDELNLKPLAAGVYVLRVQHGDKVYTKKLIVQ